MSNMMVYSEGSFLQQASVKQRTGLACTAMLTDNLEDHPEHWWLNCEDAGTSEENSLAELEDNDYAENLALVKAVQWLTTLEETWNVQIFCDSEFATAAASTLCSCKEHNFSF